jgi:hypothetical protein
MMTAGQLTGPGWSPSRLRPLADRIGEHVVAGSVIHADDTPIPVLAPGNGKTKTGRLSVYLQSARMRDRRAGRALPLHA